MMIIIKMKAKIMEIMNEMVMNEMIMRVIKMVMNDNDDKSE